MEIKLISQSNCQSEYEINGTNVLIWTIVGGQIATSLKNYKQSARWNNIPEYKTGWDSTEISWIEDQTGLETWLESAIIAQAELDARPNLTYSEAFKTENDEILIVNVNLRNYISITANLFSPITEKAAIEINDQLIEEMVEETPEIEEYIGTTKFFDNSLYYEELEFNGNTYLFDSCGCLQDDIKQRTDKFNELINLHLKDDKKSFYQAVEIVNGFDTQDLDAKVEAIAIEILS